MSVHSPPILSYVGHRDRGTDDAPPVDSPLILERLGDGVRITDPPAGWRGAAGPAALALVALMLCTVLGVVAVIPALRSGALAHAVSPAIGMVGGACLAALLIEESRRRAKWTTVIEVRGGILAFRQPSVLTARMRWPAAMVRDVRPRIAIRALKGSSAVMILPRGLGFSRQVLRNRPLHEVEWVVGVLRRELGLDSRG